MIALTHAFGFSREPFAQDIPIKDLYPLPGLQSFLQRSEYAIANRMASVITGDVGAGKSTSLRAAANSLHRDQYCVIPIIATTGSLMEFLRQICFVLGDPPVSNSIARMTATVRAMLSDVASKKMIPVILVEEAHLFRLDVFSQLHTVAQLDYDSCTLVPLVLSGQSSLIDKLLYYTSKPFASRIVGRSHIEALQRSDMSDYIHHHLTIAGGKADLFSDDAILAVHQSSGGLLRRAGLLARGALFAAAQEKCPVVSAEHVRLALSEIL